MGGGTCNVYTDWFMMCSRVPKDTYYDTQQEEADLDQEKAAKAKPGTSMYVCVCVLAKCFLHISDGQYITAHTATQTCTHTHKPCSPIF